MPQAMEKPYLINRTAPMPQTRKNGTRAHHAIWIEADLHPVFRVALDPYLRKLALTRVVPSTPIEEAAADYVAHSSKVGHVPSRHGWLAKVAQLGGFRKSSKEVLGLWSSECHAMYVTGTSTPPASLALAMVFCTASAKAPEMGSFFKCCLKDKWNVTPSFPDALWNAVLNCAAKQDDEKLVMQIFEEMIDVQVNFEAIRTYQFARAVNTVKDPELYARVKKLLFALSPEKVEQLFRAYTTLRANAENDPDTHPMPENDNMYYHVHWHNRIRHPLQFNPRQLYFDYVPSTEVSDPTKFTKKTGDEIVADRLAKWKEEGLVREDYVDESKFDEQTEKFKFFARQERWKKKPTFWEKRPGWTPAEAKA